LKLATLADLRGLDLFHSRLNDYLPARETEDLGYPLNSIIDDFGIITIAGGISNYFSSNRRGNDDIYRFDAESRTKPLA